MLTIPRRNDNRLPLTAIASLLVLINASLIGLDIYQRNTSPSPGIFTASNTTPTKDDTEKQAAAPAEEKSSDEQPWQPSNDAPATQPAPSGQSASSPTNEPDQAAPESTPANETGSDASVAVESATPQDQPTLEPGRGGGGTPSSQTQPTTSSSTTPSASTSPSTSDNSDDSSLDTQKTFNTLTTTVNPLLQQPDTGTIVEIK